MRVPPDDRSHVFLLHVPRLSLTVEKAAIIAALVLLAEYDTLWPFEKVSPFCA